MSDEGINLDGMSVEELEIFSEDVCRSPKAMANTLFPSAPTNYVEATNLLAGYARQKALAMRFRAAGRIQLALQQEAVCDRLYKLLPEFARW